MLRIMRALLAFLYILADSFGYVLAKLSKKSRPLWIVSERGFDARDNGYHFFKYMIGEHPEIDTRYLISTDSSDYKKVSEIGPTIQPGTLEHFELMFAAEALISTHAFGYTPDMIVYNHLAKHHLFKPKAVQVFLQHGVLDKDTEWLYRKNFAPDMFVVSTYSEEKLVKDICKQPENVVVLTGLPRFDNLNENQTRTRKILFMPTWRSWLQNNTEEELMKSEYYAQITNLLTDPELKDILQKNGYEMLFYPHIEMQCCKKFKGSDAVRILNASTADVQELLKESDLLITDYSSVYSDFLYMKKPVIFFQWDKDRFEEGHYGLAVDHRLFGEVVEDETDLVKLIREYVEGNQLKVGVIDFKYHDKNNCERVFSEIKGRCLR